MGDSSDSYFPRPEVKPEEKSMLLKALYDAAQKFDNPFGEQRAKLTYFEIVELTGMESSKVLNAAAELQEEGYLSRFRQPDKITGPISFGLSDASLLMTSEREHAYDVIKEISYSSKQRK